MPWASWQTARPAASPDRWLRALRTTSSPTKHRFLSRSARAAGQQVIVARAPVLPCSRPQLHMSCLPIRSRRTVDLQRRHGGVAVPLARICITIACTPPLISHRNIQLQPSGVACGEARRGGGSGFESPRDALRPSLVMLSCSLLSALNLGGGGRHVPTPGAAVLRSNAAPPGCRGAPVSREGGATHVGERTKAGKSLRATETSQACGGACIGVHLH